MSAHAVVLAFAFPFARYYSVSADAIRANDNAIYNSRTVIMLDALTTAAAAAAAGGAGVAGAVNPPAERPVAFVAIGATCVGSVLLSARPGDVLRKGAELSWFEFGGSTVVMLFPAGRARFDADLVAASAHTVELLVRQGQRIGEWIE